MKSGARILSVAFLVVCAVVLLFAQNTTYARFPISETLQTTKWHQIAGCDCGLDQTYLDSFRKAVTVTPTAVTTKVGQKVQIRFDASIICNGQDYRDLNGVRVNTPGFAGVGNVVWQAGTIQTLPDIFGIITLSGYTQAKTDSIQFSISVQCYDTGAKCTDAGHYRVCSTAAKIPVTVNN